MNKRLKYHLLTTFLFVLTITQGFSQTSPSSVQYPYNHLPWYTIESDHFLVHYQDGSEITAGEVSLIANKIYNPITELYQYEPDRKISIVIQDRVDYANGAAYFFDDKIDIWVPPLDTPFRGTHPWLQNVITHEFTHIIQMGSSMKRSPILQSVYVQWLSYEDVRRPDVLYGTPNGIISHPFSTVSIPAWFSEGTAQYMREHIFFDYWDTHRDMILRLNILNDSYLSFEEMGDFNSKNSLENEMVYNQGFDFIRYLTERYGEQVIAELSNRSGEGSNNFNKVIETVTGISGKELFDDWISTRKEFYTEFISNLEQTRDFVIIEDGFMNFYPQYHSGSKTFAYLSNKNRDFSSTQLFIETPDSSIIIDELENGLDETNAIESSAHLANINISIDHVGNRFSFSPDGKKITYSKADRNKYGEEYQDIFILSIDEPKEIKITENARLQDPVWHPTSDSIAAVKLQNGTQNLILINPESKETKQLTSFCSGETVFTPVWSPDGRYIYFSAAKVNNRDLYRFDTKNAEIQILLEDSHIDFRDPWVDSNHQYLYFSSDFEGIFNIYRKKIDDHSIQKLTQVPGGAFMPFAASDSLYFSKYTSDGYKITVMGLPEFKESHTLSELIESSKNRLIPVSKSSFSNQFDSKQSKDFVNIHDSLRVKDPEDEIQVSFEDDPQVYRWRPYTQTTTGLSVIPVIRFDNYSKLHGSNSRLIRDGRIGDFGRNLIRDFKAGAYFTSRDVTERLSIFAGALFGWGSTEADSFTDFFSPNRLNNLDRDLFFILDYTGIPFIKRSWSPRISLEVYNFKRNVRDGFSIEEFPCTSCLPIQNSIDIRYQVWEANLFLRSKLNPWSLLEFGTSFSPYSVATDGFFSNELREFIPGSTTEYFKGSSFSASYIANTILPTRHADIAPEGARASATFQIENGRLLQEFEIEEGSLSPVFDNTTNYSLELKSQLGGEIDGGIHGMLTSRIFNYFNDPKDFFYLDYIGGLSGMRSYPYFAIGGQHTIWGRFSILAPIKRNINRQIGAYTLDKIYANLFFEAGNGWQGPLNIGDNIKTGIGTELRFALNSYYIFPLKFFISTTYGFNRFNVTLPEQFISTSSADSIIYGKEMLFYFGLTFDFNQL